MPSSRSLHLNLNFLSAGSHAAAWLWPGNRPEAFVDPAYWVETAQLAEEGTFDAIFLADHPSMPQRSDFRPFQALEPSIVLTAIAAATRHIGLIATISSSYNAPYNIARRFASLDIVSGGRVGINIVTTADKASAFNFGSEHAADHATRYDRALEFTDVVKTLWNSWQDDALVGDTAAAQFVDPARVHEANHHGRYFRVRGPLNVPRSRQGHPVVVQAGGSDDGLELAARHAEAVFTAAHTPEDSRAYASRLRARAEALGRPAGSVVVLPGLVTIIGSTEAEARQREEELNSLAPIEQGLAWASGLLRIDATRYDLDAPLPADLPIPSDGMTTFARGALTKARRQKLTLRELIRSQVGGGSNHRAIVGTPEHIAASIEDWFLSGAADGFNLMPDVLPSGLEAFVRHVVPILRRRGIFREAYEGDTLRDHLGLARPAWAPPMDGEAVFAGSTAAAR
jgi:FMN-dependent oxidoreductase (nitrilotriacetate monooxygenase family)